MVALVLSTVGLLQEVIPRQQTRLPCLTTAFSKTVTEADTLWIVSPRMRPPPGRCRDLKDIHLDAKHELKTNVQAPCCGKLYVCRLCHDAEENHEMDRFKVTEVQCSDCLTVQQAQQTCQQCNAEFGEYYCDICHLFDKDKKQYHCQPCGICRIGPREKYFHCDKCNLCLVSSMRGNHKCVENVSRQNCPVCMEDIHTSRIGAQVLPCGHLLHKTCFDAMIKTGAYRCPLCMHSAWDMDTHWEHIDKEIALSPMPTEYQDATVKIICNDCQAHCTVAFHVLGMKCTGCGSYNTAQDGGLIQPPAPPQEQQGEGAEEAGPDGEQQEQQEQQEPEEVVGGEPLEFEPDSDSDEWIDAEAEEEAEEEAPAQ